MTLREAYFFSTFLVFVAALSISFDLVGFGTDFGRVLGRFGTCFRGCTFNFLRFGGIWDQFWKVFGLVFVAALLLCFFVLVAQI